MGRRTELLICTPSGLEIGRHCEDCNASSLEVKWGVMRGGMPLAYRCRECWKKRYADTIARNRAKWKLIDKARRVGLSPEEYLEMTGSA